MKAGGEAAVGGYAVAPIEEKWQREWASAAVFEAPPKDDRPSAYVLASCPLPASSVDLGHIRGYTIADAYARFRRASGEAVLFSAGFDRLGEATDPEPARTQLQRLGYSCDWERTVHTSQRSQHRWTQWLFLSMLERDLVYERDGRWLMRATSYMEANEEGLEALSGWNDAAADAQRAAVGRIDGFEVDASILGVGQLPVFTPHGDDVSEAAFVAISPLHPGADAFAAEGDAAAKLAKIREAASSHEDDGSALLETGLQASVPGVEGLLPVVVWSAVETRYGPTAVLGMPERDEVDRGVAGRLQRASGLGGMKLSSSSGKPRPAMRFRADDIPVSRPWAAGSVALPIVLCEACGSVPVPREELPVELAGTGQDEAPAQGEERPCPKCGAPARTATDTIDPRLDGMWMWLSICLPPGEREGETLDHPECQRWLPAAQVVAAPDAAELLFDQRLTAKVLGDLEVLGKDAREPFERAFVHETIRVEEREEGEYGDGVDDLAHLVEEIGADALRLALLNAAAPRTSFRWTRTPLRRGQKFLEELWEYAEPRLRDWSGSEDGEIETSSRLRRRLATWVRVAVDKVTTSFERLEMQRATHDTVLLATRIRDFEERASAEGELGEEDRAAIVDSLLVLVRLLAPCAPHICEELWQLSGQDSMLAEAAWPARSETSSDNQPRVRSSTG